jgi:hypothetical protein
MFLSTAVPTGCNGIVFCNARKIAGPWAGFNTATPFLPDGRNTTPLLAVTTIAVEHHDLETTIWST